MVIATFTSAFIVGLASGTTTAYTITRGSSVETVGYDGGGRRIFVSFSDSSLGQNVQFDALTI